MSEFVTYVLYSEKHRKHYTGYTSDLINRISSHNVHGTKGFTARYRPWKVVYVTFLIRRNKVLKHEQFLKNRRGREWSQTQEMC